MTATATNPDVDAIDRDLAELQQRRAEARANGETDYVTVLSAEIDRVLLKRHRATQQP
jgi:hypothetical protein